MNEPGRRPRRLRIIAKVAAAMAALVALAVAVLGAMILFGGPEAPPPMASIVDTLRAARTAGPPPPEPRHYEARDGAELAYRFYPPVADKTGTIAVLIHGSAGNSLAMDRLGRGLSRAGVAVYAPDMRGHGLSGEPGHIDSVETLEKDLVDLVAIVVRERHPDAPLVLVGHSSGGGFALRMAARDVGRLFDRFVLLAPYLGHDAPTSRPDSGGWVDAGVPRIVALSLLEQAGLDWLHHLPVLAFALPPARDGAADRPTRTWSYVLMRAFGPGPDLVADASDAHAPVDVLVGARDRSMVARAYADYLAPAGPDVSVTVLPGLDHMGLILEPRGVAATVRAVATVGMTE